MAKYKVVKLGWENENPLIPMVCVSIVERKKIGVEVKQPVRVKKGSKKSIAIVQQQFKEFVGKKETCTLNNKLAQLLSAGVNDKVEIDKELTESEYQAFQAENNTAIMGSMPDAARMMGVILRRA